MTTSDDKKPKKTLSLSGPGKGTLELKGGTKSPKAESTASGLVRQSFSHGRSKAVAVEVKRKRGVEKGAPADVIGGAEPLQETIPVPVKEPTLGRRSSRAVTNIKELTREEKEAREKALRGALLEEERRLHNEPPTVEEETQREQASASPAPESKAPPKTWDKDSLRRREMEELQQIQNEEKMMAEMAEKRRLEEETKRKSQQQPTRTGAERSPGRPPRAHTKGDVDGVRGGPVDMGIPLGRGRNSHQTAVDMDDEADSQRRGGKGAKGALAAPSRTRTSEERRQSGRVNVQQYLSSDDGDNTRVRSVAAVRRAREKERLRQIANQQEAQKVTRDVTIPEVITVQELSNRMAERGADVIKVLMRMGVMATINQNIDADTAELVATEFGHRPHRVSESDVEMGIKGLEDRPEDLKPRAPVVTVMGHVDHGKTSLLDALRKTDVVSGESGGITQHIGAYQVTLASGAKITFIDTPGHAAFTEMRARGATATDVVVLVVAADDGIMPQTVEAINHAKAANVPMVVAINKIDLPAANPNRVRQDLLQHSLVVEELGGDILDIEVSAKSKKGLDKLEEAILLQAEVLDLKANPNRPATGVVVESKMERGRGSVATILIQKGTLRVGDAFVMGSEWGRVRALMTDRGTSVQEASPSMPVEVLGLNGSPLAGDEMIVVENETRAREIAEFRQKKKREKASVASARGSLEQMFSQIKAGEIKELPVVIKGDVQGSIEAISGALEKMTPAESEVRVRVLQSSVGPINESDVTLASASKALIIGFNVRANPQAREVAKRDGIDIRYYSIIYNILDDMKALLSGMLAPTLKEKFLGYAEVRDVFNITKVGKVAGCMVTEGLVKRGTGVRLLRDNVVIHEGKLKTLKRFKDEVKEVREGFECGMAFESYDDIKQGDMIECYEIEHVARSL